MGWLSDMFGGDDDVVSTTTSVQASEIPGYIQDYSKENLGIAAGLADRQFEPYEGALVAGFTDDQTQAFQNQRDNMGAWKDDLASATSTMKDISTSNFGDADLSSYMNPYLSSQYSAVNRGYDTAQNQLDAKAATQGAFGNSRRGIVDADLGARRGDALSDVDRLAFENAQKSYFADRASQMAGATGLASLAGQNQNQLGVDNAALATYGAQQQGLNQLGLDAGYQQFLREQATPLENFNIRQAALAGTPYNASQATTGTSTSPGGNSFMSNIGSLGQLTSGVGNFFSTPKGGQSAATGFGKAFDSFKSILPKF